MAEVAGEVVPTPLRSVRQITAESFASLATDVLTFKIDPLGRVVNAGYHAQFGITNEMLTFIEALTVRQFAFIAHKRNVMNATLHREEKSLFTQASEYARFVNIFEGLVCAFYSKRITNIVIDGDFIILVMEALLKWRFTLSPQFVPMTGPGFVATATDEISKKLQLDQNASARVALFKLVTKVNKEERPVTKQPSKGASGAVYFFVIFLLFFCYFFI